MRSLRKGLSTHNAAKILFSTALVSLCVFVSVRMDMSLINNNRFVLDATDEDAIEEKKNKERKRQKEDKISTIWCWRRLSVDKWLIFLYGRLRATVTSPSAHFSVLFYGMRHKTKEKCKHNSPYVTLQRACIFIMFGTIGSRTLISPIQINKLC